MYSHSISVWLSASLGFQPALNLSIHGQYPWSRLEIEVQTTSFSYGFLQSLFHSLYAVMKVYVVFRNG